MSAPRHVEDDVHALLDPPPVTYTSTSKQRAFLVWTLLGHKNRLTDVCDYYRRLEILEESFTPERRKESQDYEYRLRGQPPKSEFLQEHFPTLYPKHKVQYRYPKEMREDRGSQGRVTNSFEERDHIVEASAMMTHYCQTHLISTAEFLREFHQFANQAGLKENVRNMVVYIRYRNAQEERQLEANYRQYDMRFLNTPPPDNMDEEKQQIQCDALKKERIGERSESGHAEVSGKEAVNGKASGGRNDYAQMPLSSIHMNGNSARPQASTNHKQTKELKQNGVTTKAKQSTKTVRDKERSFFEKVAIETEEKQKVHETKAVDTSECEIDDVLVKITDLNLEYGNEINNNDKILTETKTKPTTDDVQNKTNNSEEKLKEKPEYEPADIFDHEHLLYLNKGEKKTNVKEDRPMFAKKNKNHLAPTMIPMKPPSYCMKLKVKSKRSKGKKAKQMKVLATQSESFKSCELNVSFNLIDLDSTVEKSSISNDFAYINDDRCSTLSR